MEIMLVANCYDNNGSQYLGGGLTGSVVLSCIQAMQSIIQSTLLCYTLIRPACGPSKMYLIVGSNRGYP